MLVNTIFTFYNNQPVHNARSSTSSPPPSPLPPPSPFPIYYSEPSKAPNCFIQCICTIYTTNWPSVREANKSTNITHPITEITQSPPELCVCTRTVAGNIYIHTTPQSTKKCCSLRVKRIGCDVCCVCCWTVLQCYIRYKWYISDVAKLLWTPRGTG